MNKDDVILWADGTWCFGSEFEGYSFMSDDFTIISCDSPAYDRFFDEFETHE